MSSGLIQDWNETKEQIRNPNPLSEGRTWLRHAENAQAGKIDIMLLAGTYSVEDMITELRRSGLFDQNRSLSQCRKRILNHFSHLQNGDSWNRNCGMKPHELKIKEINGKWRFIVD